MHDNIVGSNINTTISTVFGDKPQVYCDFTASGKSLKFIEGWLKQNVMPLYANTHTQMDASGKQTNLAREQARAIIKRTCNAASDDYALIFIGTGSTSAINLLVSKLKIAEICEKVKADQVGS